MSNFDERASSAFYGLLVRAALVVGGLIGAAIAIAKLV